MQYFFNKRHQPSRPGDDEGVPDEFRPATQSNANTTDTLPSPATKAWAEMNLGAAFDAEPRILRDQVDADTFTNSGQIRSLHGHDQRHQSHPFRITLAWTDATRRIGRQLVENNNLDLTVIVNGGNI